MLQCEQFIKLGFTDKPSIAHRLNRLQSGSPFFISVLTVRPGTWEQEQELHAGAKAWHHRGDWYNDCPELREYCDKFFYPDSRDPNAVTSESGGAGPQSSSHGEQDGVHSK